MNDSAIISTISKVHFIIVSFLTFFILSLCIIFIQLQTGVTINKIKLPHLLVEKLYIKWDKKINLTIESISATKSSKKKSKPFTVDEISTYLRTIGLFSDLFSSVSINKIEYNKLNATFRYNQGSHGFFIASSPKFSLKTNLSLSDTLLHINVASFEYYERNVKAKGDIIINNVDNVFDTKLDISLFDDLYAEFYVHSDQQKLSYVLESKKSIKKIKTLLQSLHLPVDVQPWVLDAVALSSLDLHYCYGWLYYDKLDEAVKNLFAYATLNDLNYTFDKQVEAVKTSHTDIFFLNGVLNIHPQNAYIFGDNLEHSWLDINLNDLSDPILTLFLIFDSQFDQELKDLLLHYHIDIPFIQKSGTTNTFLTLPVHLINVRIGVSGYFRVAQGLYNYLGLDLNVSHADVTIDNLDVDIKNLSFEYHDKVDAKADARGELHLGDESGFIDFNISQIHASDKLYLDTNTSPLQARYYISKDQDEIRIGASQWRINQEHELNVDAVNIPFDLKKAQAHVPISYLSVDDITKLYIQGDINLRDTYFKLEVDLLDLDYGPLTLAQSNVPLTIIFDENLSIVQSESSFWKLNNTPMELLPSIFGFDGQNLKISHTTFKLKNLMEGTVSGHYNTANNIGIFKVKNYQLQNRSMGKIFNTDKQFNIRIRQKDDAHKITIAKYNISYNTEGKGWQLNINDLAPLVEDSTLLQEYNITNGSLTLYSKDGSLPFYIRAKNSYPYPILVQDNTPVYNYLIDGIINKDETQLHVNKELNVSITKEIHIQANGVGFSVPAIVNFLAEHKTKTPNSNQKTPIYLNAKNSHLFINKDRSAYSDTMNFSIVDGIIDGGLQHRKGGAVFHMEDNYFDFFGKNFGDSFMQGLFHLGDIQGGTMAFNFRGTTESFSGLVEMKKTTLKDYKFINNILAFINTIPSLATLHLPDYSNNGLAFHQIYSGVTYDNDILYVHDFYMDSEELDIFGEGTVDFPNNSIDMKLKLKTDLGSSFSKVPVLGHIVLGDDKSIATSLEISGALDDPKVDNGLASDIVTAPFNILKRTLTLPFHIFKEEEKKKE